MDGRSAADLSPVVDVAGLGAMVAAARRVHVARSVARYCVRLCGATRQLPELRLGASARGSVALVAAVRVHAAAEGREFVVVDDVKALAGPVLAHRLLLTGTARLSGVDPRALLARLDETVPVPRQRSAD
jgi:MoxR-like ATPase